MTEEAGLSAREWIPLGNLHTSNSVSDETATLWLARGLEQWKSNPESTEGDMRLWRLPFAEAVEMALDGRLTDAITVACLLRAWWWLDRNK